MDRHPLPQNDNRNGKEQEVRSEGKEQGCKGEVARNVWPPLYIFETKIRKIGLIVPKELVLIKTYPFGVFELI